MREIEIHRLRKMKKVQNWKFRYSGFLKKGAAVSTRGLGILPNKDFSNFGVSQNLKNSECVPTLALLAIP